MSFSRKRIEDKILTAALERFLGKIDIHRLRAGSGCRHRKRAGVSEAVQHPFRSKLPQEPPIFSLIDKQPNRIARAEIDAELEMIFGRNGLEVFAFISGE